MEVLNIASNLNWSWTLVNRDLFRELEKSEIYVHEKLKSTSIDNYDVILSQHPFLNNQVLDNKKVISRLGGFRLFKNDENRFDDLLSEVFAIVATNNYLYNLGLNRNRNTFLIPSGIDLKVWTRANVINKRFVVGFVGNISLPKQREFKGYDLALNACQKLKIDFLCALYGENQIEHDKMISEFYSKVDVILLPTISEGSSNVIMESLAVGIPVITTNTAGYHGERLEDGKNVIFCERNEDNIVDCLLSLKRNIDLRGKLSCEGRRFAEENHDLKVIAALWTQIITNCFNHQGYVKKNKSNNKRGYVSLHSRVH
jgi:glycosyltransferase involved in cell wall biosynthesis